MRGSLRGLRLRGDDQRMARVDRHHRCPDAEAGYRGADQTGQADGVVIELLREPDLPNAGIERLARLGDRVVDVIAGLSVGDENDSCGHMTVSDPAPRNIPFRSD